MKINQSKIKPYLLRNLLILILFIPTQITYAQSNEVLKKDVETDSITAIPYYDKGVSKAKLKDFNGAISDYTKAINLNPKYAESYNNRGYAKRKSRLANGQTALSKRCRPPPQMFKMTFRNGGGLSLHMTTLHMTTNVAITCRSCCATLGTVSQGG